MTEEQQYSSIFIWGIDTENTHGIAGLIDVGENNCSHPEDIFEGTFDEMIEYIKDRYLDADTVHITFEEGESTDVELY
jgi:HEPN domain-containing protein